MGNIKITVKNVKVKQMEVEDSPKKLAVEFEYNPAIRVCVPINGDEDIFDVEEAARKLVLEKLRTWSKEEIIDWVTANINDYYAADEPYNEEYDD
jgi:hypothetical protein